jgi:hypothetical protein
MTKITKMMDFWSWNNYKCYVRTILNNGLWLGLMVGSYTC